MAQANPTNNEETSAKPGKLNGQPKPDRVISDSNEVA